MLSPQLDYRGPWEQVRQTVIDDLQHITSAINALLTATGLGTNVTSIVGGGTGTQTFTAHAVVLGQGTDPLTTTGVGTTNTVLRGVTGANPVFGSIVEGDFAFTDLTTANVLSTKHGLAPKSPADATQFLNGAATPAFAAVKDSDLATTDITTNDVSTSKHGFTPKLPNDATKFLNGTGAYSIPAAGLPAPVGSASLGQRIMWWQKGNNTNSSSMDAVGQAAATITGGSGVFDSAGYWARPTGAAGGSARWDSLAFADSALLPILKVRVRTPSALANIRLVVSLNEYLAGVNTDTPSTTTQRGVYVRYSTAIPDGGWVCQTVDGSGRSTSGTILAIATSTVYVITIQFTSTSNVFIDINGTSTNITNSILATGIAMGAELTAGALSGAVTPSIDIESVYCTMN